MLEKLIDNFTTHDNVREIVTKFADNYSHTVDTVIVIPTYNRLQILQETITSLSNTNLENTLVIIVDDNSNTDTVEYLKNLSIMNIPLICLFKKQNKNMFDSFKLAFDACLNESNLKYYVIMDSDTIHKQDWLIREKELFNEKNQTEKCIVTGFNTKAHLITAVDNKYCKKQSIGGINILFNKEFYVTILRDVLIDYAWDWAMCDRCNRHRINMYCTTPSVIQHIGHLNTTMQGRIGIGDTAFDFN